MYVSVQDRLMGVRNAHYECQLNRIHRHLEQQRLENLRRLKVEVSKVEYDYKVMQVESKQNEIEQKRRENPHADTTYEDMFLQKSATYIHYNPDDCAYLSKKNQYRMRSQTSTAAASTSVHTARRLLQDLDIQRRLMAAREKHKAQSANTMNTSVSTPRRWMTDDSSETLAEDETEASELLSPKSTATLSRDSPKGMYDFLTLPYDKASAANNTSSQVYHPEGKAKCWGSLQSPTRKQTKDNPQKIPPVSLPCRIDGKKPSLNQGQSVQGLRRCVSDLSSGTPRQHHTVDVHKLELNSNKKLSIISLLRTSDEPTADGNSHRDKRLPMIRATSPTHETLLNQDKQKKRREKNLLPTVLGLDIKEADDYDVEERLRELGIIKDRPPAPPRIIPYTCRSLDSSHAGGAVPPCTGTTSLKQPLTRQSLQYESDAIQTKIDLFFEKLDGEKQQTAGGSRECEDTAGNISAWEMLQQNDPMLPYHSKVMQEKWKKITTCMMSKFSLTKYTGAPSLIPALQHGSTAGHEASRSECPLHRSEPSTLGWPLSDKTKIGVADSSAAAKRIFQGNSNNRHLGLPHKKSSGIPGFSAERSKRHTATFRLAKMVQQLMVQKTKFQMMQIDEMKEKMSTEESGTDGTKVPHIIATTSAV